MTNQNHTRKKEMTEKKRIEKTSYSIRLKFVLDAIDSQIWSTDMYWWKRAISCWQHNRNIPVVRKPIVRVLSKNVYANWNSMKKLTDIAVNCIRERQILVAENSVCVCVCECTLSFFYHHFILCVQTCRYCEYCKLRCNSSCYWSVVYYWLMFV